MTRVRIAEGDEGIVCVYRRESGQMMRVGEFKSHEHARTWLSRQRQWDHADIEIVVKHSRRDRELRTPPQP